MGFANSIAVSTLVMRALKRGDEAVACFERALALNRRDTGVLNNLSSTLFELKRYGDALMACERALAIDPDSAEAFNNRGNTLQETGRLEEALASYDRSLALKPDFAEVWHNRGGALQALNRHREALVSYERALALRPDYADAHWNESLARLCLGEFETGFAKFEWRWRTSDAANSIAKDPKKAQLSQDVGVGRAAIAGPRFRRKATAIALDAKRPTGFPASSRQRERPSYRQVVCFPCGKWLVWRASKK